MKARPPAWAVNTVADQHALDQCHWDDTEFNQFKRFASKFCIQTQDEWSGKPVVLTDYQEQIYSRLLSWKKQGNTVAQKLPVVQIFLRRRFFDLPCRSSFSPYGE